MEGGRPGAWAKRIINHCLKEGISSDQKKVHLDVEGVYLNMIDRLLERKGVSLSSEIGN